MSSALFEVGANMPVDEVVGAGEVEMGGGGVDMMMWEERVQG